MGSLQEGGPEKEREEIVATNFNRAPSGPGKRSAPTQDTIAAQPAKQTRSPLIRFGKRTMDDAAEVETFIDASGNRGPLNDLYERINFLRTGRRTRRAPGSY